MEFGFFYHALMLVVDLLLIRSMLKHSPTTIRRGFALCVIGVACAVVLAIPELKYAAVGVFLHGGIFLAAACFLVFRQRIDGKRRWKLTLFLGGLASLALFIGIEGFLIEPTALTVKYYTIRSPKITKPVRIAFLADFQTDNIGDYERRTLELLKTQKADMILFGGDYIQARTKQHEEKLITDFRALYQELNITPPLGIYAVKGNQEVGTWIGWNALLHDLGIYQAQRTITLEHGDIRLTLLGLHDSFVPTQRRFSNPRNRFHIVVGHAPIFSLGKPNADLLLAGHTHGGQVQIPGFGPMITLAKGLPRRWASGKTTLPGGGTLIVSHGTGLERGRAPRIRLFCRPDFVVIDLLPEN